MAQISRSALVMFNGQQMFDLVNDINAYPQFIPNCAKASSKYINDNEIEGSLLIKKAGIEKWFTTHNKLHPGKSIELSLVNGPFKFLTGQWVFTELDSNACKVELQLEFEFSSKMIELAFGKIFNQVAVNMVNAFSQRAKVVYG
ncbi:type II toxin-antitoxin system RatA family toxin [Psychrosphaera sp. B3R10]|uniref:Type II toxin-antitoxin system RatA family toxin n=1 Tax=Psychrosphaera algicola TaxID=3023714 RepID=A0ABT5FIX6_9GAMM|nr:MULTISPECIES: type II toxin-antitoxin system RatA family toxin [unclassified Psychrosphaera]MBU2882858.1 type II toxin-antitoxin system RatA family toxin [Psychrosphaera sp. I2R16]MBU2990403.1 type II toxin-antitoxin system RatA family toxin [Psychrosphaera sp. B3R10]MDC2891154.1 type II toxin-antitoxin system RatA family toxin [Psychrosphaera sp. G1-22]MDO6718624.1 type II toxin-antitoxin system RatA family toxin [Psychrosphaera sp. 1_MG-2023]